MFGIDSEMIKKVLQDIEEIKAAQSEMNAKLDEILARLPEKSVSA